MHALSGLILGFQQDLDACTHTSHLVSSSTRSHTTAPTRARPAARPSHHWLPQTPPSRYQRRAWRAERPAALDSAAILGRAPATWASHAESRAAESQGGESRRPSLRCSPAHCARERDRVHDEIRSGASPSLPDMSAKDEGVPCLPRLSLFVRVTEPFRCSFWWDDMVYTEADAFREAGADRKRMVKWESRKYKQVHDACSRT